MLCACRVCPGLRCSSWLHVPRPGGRGVGPHSWPAPGPSADVLLHSVVALATARSCPVSLLGMGTLGHPLYRATHWGFLATQSTLWNTDWRLLGDLGFEHSTLVSVTRGSAGHEGGAVLCQWGSHPVGVYVPLSGQRSSPLKRESAATHDREWQCGKHCLHGAGP